MARSSNNREKINFYVSKDVLEALRRLAEKQARPMSELIRDALRVYVLSEAQKISAETKLIKDAGR